MAVYVADRYLPGATLEDLAAAQQAAIQASEQFTAEGKPVRYLRSMWVPAEGHVMCLFESGSPEVVREVNESAKIPFTRILEALDLPPQ